MYIKNHVFREINILTSSKFGQIFVGRNTNLDVTLEGLFVDGGILAEVAGQGALLQVHRAHVAAQREQIRRGVVAG
jgi:hypothetical protein